MENLLLGPMLSGFQVKKKAAVQDAAFEPVADDVENFEVDAAVHEEEQDDGAEEDAADVSYQKVRFRLIYT